LPPIYTQIESYEAENINRRVFTEFYEKNPRLEIIGPAKSNRLLNQNNLVNEWNIFLENYSKYGRPDLNILSKIRNKLKTDAVMQGEILDIMIKDGQYQVNTAITSVTVKYRIFDLNRGKLLWEATSHGIKEIGFTFEKAPPVRDAIKPAIDKIIQWLPVL